ncbi:MAG: metallophosphoesterase [Paraclostridium sp.]
MKLKILATADIHFERLNLDQIEAYTKYFVDSLRSTSPDIFVIAGDLTDSRNMKAESDEYKLLNNFLTQLSKECKILDTKFIILEGTPSHDGKVGKNIVTINRLEIEYKEKLNVEVINGYRVLFMPEMYCSSIEAFNLEISEAIDKTRVDICIFHGMFDFPIPALKQIDSNFNNARSVVINNYDFHKKYVKIASFGGHVHKAMSEDKCFYLGRFINEKHQHPESDLFGLKLISLDDERFTIERLDNPHLLNYKFVTLEFNNQTSVDRIMDQIYIGSHDNETTVFVCIIDNDKESRHIFKLWRNIYKPLNFKRKIVNPRVSGVDPSVVSKVSSITLDTCDIDSMINELYHEVTGKILDNNTLQIIKGEIDEQE